MTATPLHLCPQRCLVALLLVCVLLLSHPLPSLAAPKRLASRSAPSSSRPSLKDACIARCDKFAAPHHSVGLAPFAKGSLSGASNDPSAPRQRVTVAGVAGAVPLVGLAAYAEPTPAVRQNPNEEKDWIDHYVPCARWAREDPRLSLGNICELSFFSTFKDVCVPACLAGEAYVRPTIPVCTGLGSQIKLRACEAGFVAAIDQTLELLVSHTAKQNEGREVEEEERMREEYERTETGKKKAKATTSKPLPKSEEEEMVEEEQEEKNRKKRTEREDEEEEKKKKGKGEGEGEGTNRQSATAGDVRRRRLSEEGSEEQDNYAYEGESTGVGHADPNTWDRVAEEVARRVMAEAAPQVTDIRLYVTNVWFEPTSSIVEIPVIASESVREGVTRFCVAFYMRSDSPDSSVPKPELIDKCAHNILMDLVIERPEILYN